LQPLLGDGVVIHHPFLRLNLSARLLLSRVSSVTLTWLAST
jgi:hypothetical protein